ncbi:MAG TPA: ATP-binding protein [Alphaproteobacteria bacterium]|nr:ATP-binding protein [Alphaproteobacteria bacterium]
MDGGRAAQAALRPNGISLRRWLLYLALAGVAGTLLVAGAAGWFSWLEQKAQFGLSFVATSRATTVAVERELDQAVALARGLAVSHRLAEGDIAGFEQQARQVLAAYGYFLILNPGDSGRQLINTQLPAGEPLPALRVDPDWIDPAARAGRVAVKPLRRSYASGKWITIVQLPIMAADTLRYVINIVIPSDAFQRIIDDQRLPAKWNGVILDQDWTVVARVINADKYLGKKGATERLRYSKAPDLVYETHVLEGPLSLSSLSRSARYGWSVAFSMPEADMFRQVLRPILLSAAGGFLVAALAMGAITFLVAQLIVGIRSLAEATAALGRGETVQLPRFRVRELALVGQGMQRAAAKLQDNARLLAARIAEVTRDLRREAEERRKAEEALAHVQRLESLGQLTGGIAHDFNNQLGVIISSLETLERRLRPEDPRIKGPIRTAIEGAERSARLTRQLLAFARRQALAPALIDMNRLVSGMSNMLHRTLGERIAIETVLAGGLWNVLADVNQLENALLNLAINARDAMPEGGKLTIETANGYLDEHYAERNVGAKPGQYVIVSVTDTGTGMDAETVARAFEPFFTTKEAGRGTGLGLSQVYGFVKQSGGHVAIYSELDKGTTVKLYLPRALAADAKPDARSDQPPVRASPASGTILLVEDNELLAASIAAMLEEHGYRVLLAQDGAAALKLLREEPRVDLLFTDLGLPGDLNGRELAEEAQGRYPGIRVLFTTGYARNANFHNGRLQLGVELIVKPFTSEELVGKIRRILAGS